MKKNRFVLLAAVFVLTVTLTSCTMLMKEASLSTSNVEGNAVVPVVAGFLRNDAINDRLKEAFLTEAAQLAPVIQESEGRLRVEYRLTQEKEGLFGARYAVTMYLADDRDAIELKTVNISGLDTVKPLGQPDTSWLDSLDVAEGALLMNRLGMDVDPASLGDTVGEREAIEVFIRLYEDFLGGETDISGVQVETDDLTRKAYLLEYTDYYGSGDYSFDENLYLYRLSMLTAKAIANIERDVYGRQSETVTGEEFVRLLRTLHDAMPVHEVEGSEHRWSALCDVDTDEILRTMALTDSPFTRRDAAELLGRITKDGVHYKIKYNDRNLERVEDSFDSIWVRRAVTHGFMNYYGESSLFAPSEELTLVNAITSAQCYLNTRYNDWSYAVNYAWDNYLTRRDVMVSAVRVADYFRDRTDADRQFETKTVVNDRDYDWFFSQKDTGKYSAVNCMPSIATMASHWYDADSKATVQKMRRTSDNGDGWTAYELRCGLSAYKVPYTVEDATLESITAAIDAGGIVLAQYSDRPYGVSGHCYVIYGYRKYRDSYTFIVNDSDSLTHRAELFGRKAGNGDEIEARFAMWTISRFVDDVTVVGVDDSNN